MDLRSLRYFVAVAEERHVGRAAVRLHMTQPPLSRAIKQLETELGAVLLDRSATGVTPTAAGTVLYDEARTLLEQADQLRVRVGAAAGTATITIGLLADSAEDAGTRLAADFRARHPDVRVLIREADFADPTTGLRSGLVDVALTRAPFEDAGISIRVLRSDPIGVVLRTADPLAGRVSLTLGDLAARRWFQLPAGTDPVWRDYWNGAGQAGPAGQAGQIREGPVVRTIHECLQAVLWNGTVGLAPLTHALPAGLTCVPLTDMPPSRLVVAWNSGRSKPLIRSFTQIATGIYATRRDREPGGPA
jgi:DNA-binding transcriptional LysR family regulator